MLAEGNGMAPRFARNEFEAFAVHVFAAEQEPGEPYQGDRKRYVFRSERYRDGIHF